VSCTTPSGTQAPPHARPDGSPHAIRVVVCDDHAVVRDGLRALVDAQQGLTVVGEAADGDEAYRRACDLKPDILLLDVSMPGVGGAGAAERIARARCWPSPRRARPGRRRPGRPRRAS
jgi:CheY-like chemotaxis protein